MGHYAGEIFNLLGLCVYARVLDQIHDERKSFNDMLSRIFCAFLSVLDQGLLLINVQDFYSAGDMSS